MLQRSVTFRAIVERKPIDFSTVLEERLRSMEVVAAQCEEQWCGIAAADVVDVDESLLDDSKDQVLAPVDEEMLDVLPGKLLTQVRVFA